MGSYIISEMLWRTTRFSKLYWILFAPSNIPDSSLVHGGSQIYILCLFCWRSLYLYELCYTRCPRHKINTSEISKRLKRYKNNQISFLQLLDMCMLNHYYEADFTMSVNAWSIRNRFIIRLIVELDSAM